MPGILLTELGKSRKSSMEAKTAKADVDEKDALKADAVVEMETTNQQESPSTRKRRNRNSESPSASRVSQSPPSVTNDACDDDDGEHPGGKSNGDNGAPSKKKTKTSKQQDKEDMSWICAECKEADCGLVTKQQPGTAGADDAPGDSFLICEGWCHRIFHVPCAGLSKVPDSDDAWLCKDCTKKEHACAFCSEYGVDNVDVFPCQDELCGLFFHEACLQTHHVDYNYQKTNENVVQSPAAADDEDLEEEETPKIPLFTCPAHHCWTCTQKDMIRLEKEEAIARRAKSGTSKKNNNRKKKNKSIFQSKPGRLFVSNLTGVVPFELGSVSASVLLTSFVFTSPFCSSNAYIAPPRIMQLASLPLLAFTNWLFFAPSMQTAIACRNWTCHSPFNPSWKTSWTGI